MNLIKQKNRSFWMYDNRGYNYCPNCEGDFIDPNNQTVLWGKLDGKVLVVKDNKTYCSHCGVRILDRSGLARILAIFSSLPLIFYLSSLSEPIREHANGWVFFALLSLVAAALYLGFKYDGLFADKDDFLEESK